MRKPELAAKSSVAAAAVAALMLAAAPAAQASLIGDTVNCGVVPAGLWSCDNPTAVVGSGSEFRLLLVGTEFFNVDIGANSVRMNYTRMGSLLAGAGEALTLSDLDWVGMLGEVIGITNFATSGTTGIDAGDVTFGPHQVRIDFTGGFNPGTNTFLSFDLVTQHRVPEPSTAALFALGGLLAVVARRRRVAR